MKTKAIPILLLFVILVVPILSVTVQPATAVSDDWLNGWTYRRALTISNATGAGTDYQVLLNITWDSSMQSDFDDLRFTSIDGTTLLDAWELDRFNEEYSTVFVEVKDSLESESVLIWMYYGNDTVADYWDGPATFPFFDDFEDGSLNATLWSETASGGTYGEIGGHLNVEGASPERIQSNFEFGNGYAVCFQDMLMTAKAVNKYIYAGLNNATTSDFAFFQSYNNAYRYATYDTGYETTASSGWESAVYAEIQMLSATKTEFFENFVSMAVHTTEETSTLKYIDLEVTGSAAGVFDYVQIGTAFIRKVVDTEPTLSKIGPEQRTISPEQEWALNGWYMIGGAIMVISSTCFAAVKIKSKSVTQDDALIFLILFIFGWCLIIGMVI